MGEKEITQDARGYPVTNLAPIRLLHLSDPHLFEDASRSLYGVNTEATFRATLARALAGAPASLDAVLVTGDVAEDGCRGTYERFRSAMAGLGVPVLCLPGNHENRDALNSILDQPPLQYCGSRDLPGWRIVMLDSHVPGEDWGRLADTELARLDHELAAAGNRHVLLCLHHQPVPVGSPWLDNYGLRNAEALQALLDRHDGVRGVLFGHVHQAFDRTLRGIRMLSTPATCAQFTPDTRTCVMDLRPPGFRWLQLMPTGVIETEVVWLDELRKTERPPDSRREA